MKDCLVGHMDGGDAVPTRTWLVDLGRTPNAIRWSYLAMTKAIVDLAWLHVAHDGEDYAVAFKPSMVKGCLLELGGVDSYPLDDFLDRCRDQLRTLLEPPRSTTGTVADTSPHLTFMQMGAGNGKTYWSLQDTLLEPSVRTAIFVVKTHAAKDIIAEKLKSGEIEGVELVGEPQTRVRSYVFNTNFRGTRSARGSTAYDSAAKRGARDDHGDVEDDRRVGETIEANDVVAARRQIAGPLSIEAGEWQGDVPSLGVPIEQTSCVEGAPTTTSKTVLIMTIDSFVYNVSDPTASGAAPDRTFKDFCDNIYRDLTKISGARSHVFLARERVSLCPSTRLVVDESQDLEMHYAKALVGLSYTTGLRIIAIGDKLQSINRSDNFFKALYDTPTALHTTWGRVPHTLPRGCQRYATLDLSQHQRCHLQDRPF